MIQDYLAPIGAGVLVIVGMIAVAYVVGRGLASIERLWRRRGE